MQLLTDQYYIIFTDLFEFYTKKNINLKDKRLQNLLTNAGILKSFE